MIAILIISLFLRLQHTNLQRRSFACAPNAEVFPARRCDGSLATLPEGGTPAHLCVALLKPKNTTGMDHGTWEALLKPRSTTGMVHGTREAPAVSTLQQQIELDGRAPLSLVWRGPRSQQFTTATADSASPPLLPLPGLANYGWTSLTNLTTGGGTKALISRNEKVLIWTAVPPRPP